MSAVTYVYVDGFNLYHRALKDTPYKWLNLKTMCSQTLAAHNNVVRIKYFTARVSGARDQGSPARQNAYLDAIGTLPEVEIFFGRFMAKTITRPLVNRIRGLPRFVEVHTTEEKGSDVNLAVQLLNDAWHQRFEVAVVISNDSDLESPIQIVRTERQLPVGLLCPVAGRPSTQLNAAASFVRHIRPGHLQQSQFPPTITNASGQDIATKPASW